LKVIILAAGIGTRLTSNYNEIPKCLIPYKNQNNIKRIAGFFTSFNIQKKDIFAVIGKKGRCWTKKNIQLINEIIPNTITNENNLITNNAFSLQLALEKIKKDNIIILDGDLFLFDLQIIEKFLFHKQSCILGKFVKKGYQNKNLIMKNDNDDVIDFGKNISIDNQTIIYGPMLKIVKDDYIKFTKILFQDEFYKKNIDRVLDIFTKNVLTKVIISDNWLNINKPTDLTKLN